LGFLPLLAVIVNLGLMMTDRIAPAAIPPSNAPSNAASSPVGVPAIQADWRLPDALPLYFGGELIDVQISWRLEGAAELPVVLVMGGISAGRQVTGQHGWWREVVGPGQALDTQRFRVLGIDFLGGSGTTTGPQRGQRDFPAISAFDQVTLTERLLAHLQIERLHAVVGASYGGMVALALGERAPQLAERLVVISAAHRTHPMATAWRSVQRAMVRFAATQHDGAEGLRLARALAMATYRSPAEFAQRFDAPAERLPVGNLQNFCFPVEKYLFARGDAYAASYVPEAFVCLSESIDLHRVDAAAITLPVTLLAVVEDQLVPLTDMRNLRDELQGPVELIEISSLYGHDAFIKEAEVLRQLFAAAL
jgi:homoserine O-acetyltransferase